MKFVTLFLPGFLVVATANSKQLKTSLCITPNNMSGECIGIQNCAVFVDAIRSGKNETFDFIKASKCGSYQEKPTRPTVCCGKHNNYLNKIRTNQRPRIVERNLFPQTCGVQIETENRIFGGSTAAFGEFPWMARLQHRRSDGLLSYGCVGFLISEAFVLTAAHCIRSKSLASLGPIYQVQLGDHNTETDFDWEEKNRTDLIQILEISEPIVHPDYSGNTQLYNDIALIPLKNPAKFTDYVFPICLLKKFSQHTQMWVSGWGKTETKRTSTKKLKVKVPRYNKVQCTFKFKPIGINILDSQICAGGEAGRDACAGDSGGPLMVLSNSSWYAEGIVSFGKGCAEKGWPGVYTSIPYYMPWIEQVLKRHLMGGEGNFNLRAKTIMEEPERWIW